MVLSFLHGQDGVSVRVYFPEIEDHEQLTVTFEWCAESLNQLNPYSERFTHFAADLEDGRSCLIRITDLMDHVLLPEVP